jgi:hypothetical protein
MRSSFIEAKSRDELKVVAFQNTNKVSFRIVSAQKIFLILKFACSVFQSCTQALRHLMAAAVAGGGGGGVVAAPAAAAGAGA